MTDRNPSTPSDISEPSPLTDEKPTIDVLHVEPDPRSTELFATFAAHFADGVSVRTVRGTEAALAAVDDADCVVTEQRLPDGSGVELVDRLRRDGEDLPVVFHTTHRGERVEARAFGAGADAYFEKRPAPGQYERILDRVRTLVEERGAGRGEPAESLSADDASSVSGPIRLEE
ncbi:response regulator [Halorubrum sp. CSM-61]|uniref:response regulator n=1 Tax=Halorubrum sp. CSM-61 TaxID=2485838 RepID=UPI000F4B1C1D|nr:response regulator [Halorubrum sp. CSM-61]